MCEISLIGLDAADKKKIFMQHKPKEKSVILWKPLHGCSYLLISSRLRLICGLSSGGFLPLCLWNFSLHFTPVLPLTFPSWCCLTFLAHKTRTHTNGGTTNKCSGSHLPQIRDYIDTYSCTVRNIPWISCSPSYPSPTRAHSRAHIQAPWLIKVCASEAVLTFYQLWFINTSK